MGFITILTFSEYNYINNAGEISLTPARVSNKEVVDSESFTYKNFAKILLKTPNVGFSSESYILADLIKRPTKTNNKVNILSINKCYALSQFSADLLQLNLFNDKIESFWHEYVLKNCKEKEFKAKLFLEIIKYYVDDILSDYCHNESIRQILMSPTNKSYYPTKEERLKIDNFLFSNVYGWKAGLTVLYRLSLEIIQDRKKLQDEYWKIPHLAKDLDIMRINEPSGPILEQKIFDVVESLDNSLSKINLEEKELPPLCYLAIVLQYASVSENKDYISLDNFIHDLKILKEVCENHHKNVKYWCYYAVVNVGQYLNGQFLCNEYKKIRQNFDDTDTKYDFKLQIQKHLFDS